MEVERPGVTQRDEGTGPRLSRRSFLEGAVLAGAAFGGAGLLGRGAPAQAAALPDIGMDAAQPAVARGLTTPLSHVRRAQSASFEPDVWVRRPFALSEVTIDGGVYRRGRDQGMVLARAYSVDTILAVFRRNAGLDTKGRLRREAGRSTALPRMRSGGDPRSTSWARTREAQVGC